MGPERRSFPWRSAVPGQAVDLRPRPVPYAAPPMRAAAGVAVVLGVLAVARRGRPRADIYLLRDRKGVLHITNAPVDPGTS